MSEVTTPACSSENNPGDSALLWMGAGAGAEARTRQAAGVHRPPCLDSIVLESTCSSNCYVAELVELDIRKEDRRYNPATHVRSYHISRCQHSSATFYGLCSHRLATVLDCALLCSTVLASPRYCALLCST
eukprot:4494513-Pyramimonas_sp.AAC.1